MTGVDTVTIPSDHRATSDSELVLVRVRTSGWTPALLSRGTRQAVFQIRLHSDRISYSCTAGNEPARSKSAVHHRVSGVSMLELMTTLCRACYAKVTRTRFPIGDSSCRRTENRARVTIRVPWIRPDKRGREGVDVSDRCSQLRNRSL
jgi:hypothetical protein